MSKFDELYEQMIQEMRREYLTLGEIEGVYDTVLKSLGLDPQAEDDPGDITDIRTMQHYSTLVDTVAYSFPIGVHPKYREDLIEDGYENLVNILDELNYWRI